MNNISALPVTEFNRACDAVYSADPQKLNVFTYQIDNSVLTQKNTYSSLDLAVIREPESALAESLRTVRTQLLLRGIPSRKKTVAVVSVNPDSGSSLFSSNLAVLFSQTGNKTLLVDANIKNPGVYQIFNLGETRGLSDVLVNRFALSETLISINTLPNLTLLLAGTAQSLSSELLSTQVFCNIHEDLAKQFDIIFYDTPAFIKSTDALMLAKHSDYVLLVVHKNRSRLTDVSTVSKQIAAHGIEIIGSVLVEY